MDQIDLLPAIDHSHVRFDSGFMLECGVRLDSHVVAFRTGCRDFDELERSNLVRVYVTNRPVRWADSWECRPFRVRL